MSKADPGKRDERLGEDELKPQQTAVCADTGLQTSGQPSHSCIALSHSPLIAVAPAGNNNNNTAGIVDSERQPTIKLQSFSEDVSLFQRGPTATRPEEKRLHRALLCPTVLSLSGYIRTALRNGRPLKLAQPIQSSPCSQPPRVRIPSAQRFNCNIHPRPESPRSTPPSVSERRSVAQTVNPTKQRTPR